VRTIFSTVAWRGPSASERNLFVMAFKSIALAFPFVLVFLGGLWIQFRRSWGPTVEPRPRLSEEIPREDWRQSRRKRYCDLPLAERNTRDRRNAAAVVKRWRKKGLP
jgi:hypothetical protein